MTIPKIHRGVLKGWLFFFSWWCQNIKCTREEIVKRIFWVNETDLKVWASWFYRETNHLCWRTSLVTVRDCLSYAEVSLCNITHQMSVLHTLMSEIASFYCVFIKYPEQCLCCVGLGSTDFDSPVALAKHTRLQRYCKASDKCVYISSHQIPERKRVLKPCG